MPFVQCKKREKHSWKSVTFSKVTLPHWCFSGVSNCANCSKSCKALQLVSTMAEVSWATRIDVCFAYAAFKLL